MTPTIADRYGVVIGVDTHVDSHTACVLDRLGAVLATIVVATTADGLAQLLAFAVENTPPGQARIWAVEGTRAHGQGLCRLLHQGGEDVCEAPKPVAAGRRRGGKSDALDAAAAARAVLGTALSAIAVPRADGTREALRILLACRRHHSDTRTAALNLIAALILTGDADLRAACRHLTPARRLAYLSTAHLDHDTTLAGEHRTRRHQLATLATQVRDLDTLLRDNKRELAALSTALCPPLNQQPGVGPVTAAVLLVAFSHPGRVRNEAAFAALAGTAPLPASSGRSNRHRLNRGGDRTLNSALHTIAITRRRDHPATRAYVQHRQTHGKTSKETTRNLKRYLTRHLFRIMTNHYQPTAA
jgi:transposase